MTDDRLRLEYIPLDQAAQWDTNPKLHDKEGIKASFREHGFKDPPKFEPELNDGTGGLVEGNGRSKCLQEMRDAGEDPPRGILLAEGGQWTYPVLFGVDAESEAAAESYAIDHNNLTLGGSDLTFLDAARMWDEQAYIDLLVGLQSREALPTTLSDDDVEFLVRGVDAFEIPDHSDKDDIEDPAGKSTIVNVKVGNARCFEDVIAGLAEYLAEHPEWSAKVAV